ncbi:ABC-type transport auxiliary lipoprotein family protein [Orbaceae bacterium ac157xtp]
MRILIVTLMLTMLLGCSSNQAEKHYFQLTSDFSQSQDRLIAHKTNQGIFIEPVQVASYLDTTGIVYQLDEVQFTTTTQNVWLTPLSDQLQNRLNVDLANLWSNYNVTSSPINNPKATIQLYVDTFQGSYTGDALLQGHWVITQQNKQTITKKFDYKIPLREAGYPALVKALSKGLQEEVIDMVRGSGIRNSD